jgi:SET domain-containing protein
MAYLEKHLVVKRSKLPGAGKGLFTTVDIPKGTRIVEYKGKRATWKEVNHDEGANGYIFYIDKNNVIDAAETKTALARYANDATGLSKVKGLSNNCKYQEDNNRVYIESYRNIPAGGEIFVSYGKEYWDVIRYNKKLEEKEKKAKNLKRKRA